MFTSLPCVVVTQLAPRIKLAMAWANGVPDGEVRLYVRRIGEVDEFAYYPALEVAGGELTFQVDNLLFAKGIGRYEARLVVSNIEYTKIQIDYRNTDKFVSVENPHV